LKEFKNKNEYLENQEGELRIKCKALEDKNMEYSENLVTNDLMDFG
jgi:hypothetical protein